MLLTYFLSPWLPLITLQSVSVDNVFLCTLKHAYLFLFTMQCVSIIGVTFSKHLASGLTCLLIVTDHGYYHEQCRE